MNEDLEGLFGERITASPFERWFYTSDFLSIPNRIKALFRTLPSAVVRPKTAEEVSAILSYCSRNGIPAVPRGGGSSGIFGAVPKRGGVVLDLMDLSGVIEVDKDAETATVEAGITWWELDRRLKRHRLAIRSYPSSAKSATVGGWIMTGGRGIGSLKYGPVSGQVLSMEVVLADGTIAEYGPGQRLECFFESEGILGIATKVTLKVRPIPEITSHHLICFGDMESLFEALKPLADTVPYSIKFYDHKYLTLLKASDYQVTDFGPGGGMLLATYDGTRGEVEDAEREVERIVSLCHGAPREGADEEWEQRFNILRIRRAVPTIIPGSVMLPLDSLGEFYSRLGKLKKRAIGLLGYVTSNSECNLMPMLATNERRPMEYTFALHTPGEIADLALSLGGKPAGLGVWNTPYASKVLTKHRIEQIRNKKGELDPKGILNPGMWLEPPLFLKPGIYHSAMRMLSILDRVLPTKIGKAEEDTFKKEVSSCVQCGYCMKGCPTRQGWVSSTPRGRILMAKDLFLNRRGQITQDYVTRAFQCTLCGRCRVDCSVDIRSPKVWIDLRSHLLKGGFEIAGLEALTNAIDETMNIVAKPNEQRGNWIKRLKLPDLAEKRKAEVVYFVGCIASFFAMTQPVAGAFTQILDEAGIDFAVLGGEEWCCGFPLVAAGMREASERYIRHNIERAKETGAKTIVTTCPGCYRVWKYEYRDVIGERHPFDVFHSTEFIAKLIEDGRIGLKGLEETVTYHDPCDLGRNSGIIQEPRYVIRKIAGLNLIELEENREYCNCCGSGGDLLLTNQDLSLAIAKRKVEEIQETGAQTVVTACPACIRAINMAKTTQKAKFNVVDVTQLVWKAMGN